MENKVLIINTGGTIGMINSEPGNENSPLRPAESWSEIAKEHPILERYKTDYIQLPKLIDSSNMHPDIWKEIAKIIFENYEKYKGFVVLHGTDTMAYTASGLSFMLKNLDKPVILTGSQVPLNFARSDALQNLITSIEIAGNDMYGIRLVPEVCIFFRDNLLRGNRARKIDATNYFGFSSPNYSPLGDIGADIRIKKNKIRKPSRDSFSIEPVADENVLVVELFPGLSPTHLKKMVDGIDNLKGIILRTFGNGNAPTTEEFLNVLEYISNKGIVIVNITQCVTGSVKMGLYETSAKLADIGVVSGGDMTPEAAIGKLMYLLGKNLSVDEVKKYMQIDLRGERSLCEYSFVSSMNEFSQKHKFQIEIPKRIKDEDLIQAVSRITNIVFEEETEAEKEVEIIFSGCEEEKLEPLKIKKKIIKNQENLNQEILLTYKQNIKRLMELYKTLEFAIKSSKKFKIENIYITIYSEAL